ncbi:energy transducer TonB [Psychrobacter lutiphocae]|uniref:energy transducer TonB n=1 Tax=Psychrobacter lutiphocae TaxID=540500 RepID=UPI001919C4C1|nr:hypothetical protein [Psychrobacter lutiphocae]
MDDAKPKHRLHNIHLITLAGVLLLHLIVAWLLANMNGQLPPQLFASSGMGEGVEAGIGAGHIQVKFVDGDALIDASNQQTDAGTGNKAEERDIASFDLAQKLVDTPENKDLIVTETETETEKNEEEYSTKDNKKDDKDKEIKSQQGDNNKGGNTEGKNGSDVGLPGITAGEGSGVVEQLVEMENINWIDEPHFAIPERLKDQGAPIIGYTLTLQITVNAQGEVIEADTVASSGNVAIDIAMERIAKTGKMQPMMDAQGQPKVAVIILPLKIQT